MRVISRAPESGQVVGVRAAVRGWSESSILMRLMANLPLPAPFTEHVRFSLERAHCRLSSHLQTFKMLHCAAVSAYVHVYAKCMSVKVG